jgi:hypothetical protein
MRPWSRTTDARAAGGRRLYYAHVAAALAIFFSLSSGALAARHYLISSSKQIKPRTLSALRANSGPRGGTGAIGIAGPRGALGDSGPAGPVGTAPTVLAPAQTESGVWAGSWIAEEGRFRYRLTASFPLPLAAPLPEGSVGYITKGSPTTTACPGVGQAAPGFLCLYETSSVNLQPPSQSAVFDPEQSTTPSQTVGRSGFAIELTAAGEDPSLVAGTFAVTAPRPPVGVIEFVARPENGAQG